MLIVLISVIPDHVFELAKQRTDKQKAGLGASRPEPFVPPLFFPKQESIPRLTSYAGVFPEEYWSRWPFNGLKSTPDPWISPYNLFKIALDHDYSNMQEVGEMCSWLTYGAPVGATGAARLPAIGRNLKGMESNGYEGIIITHYVINLLSTPISLLIKTLQFNLIYLNTGCL